jgi:glycosyltransferase involved in cell wall biosynthesis
VAIQHLNCLRILLISHQLDFSGAPLALLQLARTLIGLGCEVQATSLAAGPLGKWFAAAGVRPAEGLQKSVAQFDLVVANTVLSVPAALRLTGSPQRVLPWIHESKYFFSVLRTDPMSLGLHMVQRAAFPAHFQLAEYAGSMAQAERLVLPNCVVVPDGIHAAPNSEAMVCSGKWEQRKGQERLMRLLDATGAGRRVVFLGASRPAHVTSSRYDFTGSVAPEEAHRVIAASAGLVSTAESEVQPLAVIEAILSRRPVLLSDIPAHRELLALMPDLVLFDATDPASFRKAIMEFEEQLGDVSLLEARRRRALDYFGVAAFTRHVSSILRSYAQ